jgi:hypothetical protein
MKKNKATSDAHQVVWYLPMRHVSNQRKVAWMGS